MQNSRKQCLIQHWRGKSAAVTAGLILLYWFVILGYLEILLHTAVFGMSGGEIYLVLLFDLALAAFLALLTLLFPGKIRSVVMVMLTVLLLLLYLSQTVYYFVFGSLYTVSQMKQGGAAVASFTKELLLVVKNRIWRLLPFLFPMVASVYLVWKVKLFSRKSNAFWWVTLLAACVAFQGASIGCVQIGSDAYFSNAYFYNSKSATVDQTTQRFGLLTAFRLDLQSRGDESVLEEPGNDYYIPEEIPMTTQATTPQQTEADDAAQAESQPQEKTNPYHVLDFDFDYLNTLTERKSLLSLNQYVSSLLGTSKNQYTGMLEDYNLILLCAESFFPGAIDEELTPTLYKLANEGFIFQNYYTTFPNNTTDGEYALCMGLYPDLYRGKTSSSFYASRNSYLPFTLGNLFKEQRNITSYGYHNYEGYYYGRDESHPNLGYVMQFAGDGMEFSTSWPASDLEMMMQTVDDYIDSEGQFHAYYMTFSGHLSYDIGNNPMAEKNWDLVKDLPYSYGAKCYLSCNIELDRALEYLLHRLEEAGVLDKTAIVLAADHYPYGLTDSEAEQLLGEPLTKNTRSRSNLIFWVGGMEEPVVVDTYCCTVDVLPTILNLWGFEYDSRMLAGTDVFSNGVHVAVLNDMSFFTEKAWIDTATGEVTYLVDPASISKDYIKTMMKIVETKISLSSNILNYGYYNFVFGKGEVWLDNNSWE